MRKNLLVLTIVILLAWLAITLAGCNEGARVEVGLVRDTIFSAEISKGGTWGIFMTHDDSVAYCTPDPSLGERARDLLLTHDGEVIVVFKSKKLGKDVEGQTWGFDQCQKYCTGDGTDCFHTVILIDIRPVPMRTGEYRG